MKVRNGFTLIEIVVVSAIMAIILGITATVYANFLDRQNLNAAAEDTLSVIQKARSQTIASRGVSDGGANYGVHFDDASSPHRVYVFRANDSTQTAKQDPPVLFGGSIIFQSVMLAPGVFTPSTPAPTPRDHDIVFQRVSGEVAIVGYNGSGLATSTLVSGTIAIKSQRSNTTRTITITPAGTVSVQ